MERISWRKAVFCREQGSLACLGRCTSSRQSAGDWRFQFPDRRFGKSDAGLSGKADGKPDSALLDFCKHEQIQVEAYSPIAHGEALKNPIITELAAKYGVSAAQLCIRYVLQLGTIALPKTANPEHMKNNADVDFVITDTDFQTLLQMEELRDYGAYNIFPVFSGKPLA